MVADEGVNIHEVDLSPFKEAVSGVYSKLDLKAEADIVKSILSD